MSRFISNIYEGLIPYTPGEQPQTGGVIKLNTNENPYPLSPGVLEIYNSREAEELRLYPDPEVRVLIAAVAEYYDINPQNVIAGNGSDELLAWAFMAFQNAQRRFYCPNISYGFYPVYAEVFGAKLTQIALTGELRINIEDYKNLDGTIVLANPNAPTGIALKPEEIEEVLKTNRDNLVIIDEAYVDFGAESCVPLIKKYDNLLVIQTLSKSRNLAGARVGFAMANESIVCDLNKIKYSFNPYNLNRLSIEAGAAAIKDKEYFWRCTDMIKTTRDWVVEELNFLGLKVLPSEANFVLVRCGDVSRSGRREQGLKCDISGREYSDRLRKSNILVRYFDKPELKDCVRISIGTMEEMQKLVAATRAILREPEPSRH